MMGRGSRSAGIGIEGGMFLSSGLEIMRKIIPMNENMQEG